MENSHTIAAPEFRTIPFELSWRSLLILSAIGELSLLALTVFALRDLLAIGLTVILIVGIILLLLRASWMGLIFGLVAQVLQLRLPEERFGALVLGLLFADIGFYTLTGTATNLWNGASGIAILLPASLGAFALTGFVSAVMVVWRPAAAWQPSRAALNLAIAVLIVTAIVLGVGIFARERTFSALPSDVRLVTEDLRYSNTTLTAKAGSLELELDNHDLFWHTFTIPELGVDLHVPMQAKEQVRFTAPPGVYHFYCTIPGHELLGMQGSLTVTE